MTARWETEFWSLLSPDTARRLKIDLGLETAEVNSAPPAVSTPDPTGGALPLGTRVQMHSRDNTQIWRGYVMPSVTSTPADERRIFWDDDWVSTVPANRLEAV